MKELDRSIAQMRGVANKATLAWTLHKPELYGSVESRMKSHFEFAKDNG